MAHSDLVQALLRGLDIMRVLAASPDGLRLQELAEAAGLKKTTAHNLIRTLQARAFVEKDSANKFFLGPAIMELSGMLQKGTLMKKVGSQMLKLQKKHPQLIITFSEMTISAIVCRLRVSPDRLGELQQPLNQDFLPYISATAICLQASANNAQKLEKQFPFEEFGLNKWSDWDEFKAAKEKVISSGYYLGHNETQNSCAMAFAIPENYSLGIRVNELQKETLEEIIAAGQEFQKLFL